MILFQIFCFSSCLCLTFWIPKLFWTSKTIWWHLLELFLVPRVIIGLLDRIWKTQSHRSLESTRSEFTPTVRVWQNFSTRTLTLHEHFIIDLFMSSELTVCDRWNDLIWLQNYSDWPVTKDQVKGMTMSLFCLLRFFGKSPAAESFNVLQMWVISVSIQWESENVLN